MKKIFSFYFIAMLTISCSLFGKEPSLRPIQCQIEPMICFEKRCPYITNDLNWHRTSPLKKTIQGPSLNWSGFVARSKKSKKHSVSHVLGSWSVPTLTPAYMRTYSYIWVGMDGYSNDHIEQIGTGHKWGNGIQEDIAWFQVFPKQLYRIRKFPILPGDQIGAEVRYVGDGLFSFKLKNFSQGVVFEVPPLYTRSAYAHRSSAEWIVSVPFKDHLARPLSNFTTISFSECLTSMHGIKGGIGLSRWDNIPITMSATDGVTLKAQPSALTTGGTAFTITWKSS